MPELVIDRVTKQFKNKIAVDAVSLRLHNGVYGFLGANGAGKTTLLRMLCGVLKPTSGEIPAGISASGLWILSRFYRKTISGISGSL